ncbi:MAG: glycosyltransferase family 4 protein [Sulfitobacter sp.]
MKITFVSPPPNLSGGVRVVAIYADALRARGHEVNVVATSAPQLSSKARLKGLARDLVGRRRPSGATHYDTMQAPLTLLDHPGPVTDADVPDADVVIATWWETAFAVAGLSASKGAKFYFVQHHEVHAHLPRHLSAGSYYLPLKKITISDWLKDTMAQTYGDADVDLVPNSVDLSVFHAPPRGRQPVPTLGLMYAVQPFKGLDTSFAVIEAARRTHPDLRVVCFGAIPPHKDLPLPDNTTYIQSPSPDALRETYAMCDVFLTSSRIEGFGLPILEAMACRTPVVATRTGCAAGVISNGVNGYVAPVEDVTALAAGITNILNLEDAPWRAMSDAARDMAASYTWEDAAVRFEQAITLR